MSAAVCADMLLLLSFEQLLEVQRWTATAPGDREFIAAFEAWLTWRRGYMVAPAASEASYSRT